MSRSSWCRRTATTNRIARAGRRGAGWPSTAYARLKPIYLGANLYARQPLCEAVQATGGHFLFVCKPASHPTIQESLTGVEMPEHVARVKRGRERLTHRYRWLCDVPLRGDEQALAVNWLSVEIVNATGKVTYQNSFITDLPVDATTVAERAACGRARWKIENESFNVLKSKGAQVQGLPPRAQLRARQGASLGRARHPEPDRLRNAHPVRPSPRGPGAKRSRRWVRACTSSSVCAPPPPI